MGYAGKVAEREQARVLRAGGMRLVDMATQLDVSKGTVSTWVRDVLCPPSDIRGGPRRPSSLHLDRLANEAAGLHWGAELVGRLGSRDLLIAGAALYVGEGGKTGNEVVFVNTDQRMVVLFVTWLRTFFDIDESRLKCRLYIHQGLDLPEATRAWSLALGIEEANFTRPYRAEANPSIRHSKYARGCLTVHYADAPTKRKILGLCEALLTFECPSGIAQLAERLTVNQDVVGSIPTPGAL